MTAKIGWDQLLKIRSNVFVMEEEYRNEKQAPEEPIKRNTSTDVLRGSPGPPINGSDANTDEGETNDSESIAGSTIVENTNGEPGAGTANDNIEKPEHTIDKEEIKGSNEDVKFNVSNCQIF
jgi:hypothetical protein